MRTITIRQLSINLFKELEDLPFEVTRYGKPFCRVLKMVDEETKAKKLKEFSTPIKLPKDMYKQEYPTGPIKKEDFVRPRGEMKVEDYT